ncbi:arylsulfotransferase family protein [Nocardioides cynanchi]|uniref:arylsulfotransferase family protein n=1 Tax=Nocardioides cynanchi TaxID=2558918 RepID=UPI001EE16FE7|nr:arylsulfotransferase family protein [Nocardioides cynanchi]
MTALAAVTAALAATAGTNTTAAADGALPPPPVTVTTDRAGSAGGDIFVSPFGQAATYGNGAEILSPDGKHVVWFHAAPAGQEIADFRTQTYRGKPVLTFWQGTGLGGLAHGTDYIYDDHYRRIATVQAGNGQSADGHEFQITGRNTALVLSYATATADLTAIGGPAHQKVIDGIVQEIDIRTGRVLFEWNSADHVPYSESEQPLPASADTPWDWFHVNAVKTDGRNHLLIDARNTWTAYQVDRHSGAIDWKLGGKDSSFSLRAADGQVLNSAGRIFAWQHDAEAHGHHTYTVFDNEAAGAANTGTGVISELPYSRAVTIELDRRARTATLVDSADQPLDQLASSQGNTQLLGNGDLFTGWGSLPELSESSPSGEVVFDAHFPSGVNSYRAYRLPWHPAG